MKSVTEAINKFKYAKVAIWCAVFAFMVSTAIATEAVWNPIGPAGGSIAQITPDRGHPGVWYLLDSKYYALYRSVDNGESWQKTKINGVRKLLVHGASSEVFVVLPGNRDEYYQFVLYSSTDLGQTFHLRSSNSPSNIFDHPSDPNVLWGSGINNYYDLSVSYDRGAHWNQFFNLPYRLDKSYDIDGYQLSPDEYELSSVLPSPFDANTVYVTTDVFFYIGCGGDSIRLELTSKNGGKSWNFAVNQGGRYIYDPAFLDRAFSVNYDELRSLTATGWRHVTTRNFSDLISVPGKPNLLYAIQYGHQYASKDEGKTWSRVSLGPGGNASVLQARSAPVGSLIAGTSSGIYIIDKDTNWHQVKLGIRDASATSVVAAAHGSSILYAISGQNFLFRSTNSGRTWKNITDNLPALIQWIFVNPQNAQNIYALVPNKLVVSFDAGQTWKSLPQKVTRVFFSSDSRTTYFSRNGYNHLFKSFDGGITIQELPAQFGPSKNFINDLAFDAYNNNFYVASSRGLFRSPDQGKTAEEIVTDIAADCPQCLAWYQIIRLSARGQFIAMTSYGLFKTINEGTTWTELSPVYGTIYLAEDSGRHLYMVQNGLQESKDGGKNWEDITRSIGPKLYDGVNSITDPRFRPFYASTGSGVYRFGH